MAIGMGWPKMPPKPTCHGEVVVPAMVRAAAACFVVVAWLLYDTQVVQYNAKRHYPNRVKLSPNLS
jgi:hypothetical protein